MTEDDWVPYFTAIAGAGGAILALLFIGMQLKMTAWRGSPLRTYAVVLALVELSVPVVLSLIVLMPGETWTYGAKITGGVGLLFAGLHLTVLAVVLRFPRIDPTHRPTDLDITRIVVGTVGSASLFAWLLRSSLHGNLTSVGWISLWFLVLGLAESFVFLGHWGDDTSG